MTVSRNVRRALSRRASIISGFCFKEDNQVACREGIESVSVTTDNETGDTSVIATEQTGETVKKADAAIFRAAPFSVTEVPWISVHPKTEVEAAEPELADLEVTEFETDSTVEPDSAPIVDEVATEDSATEFFESEPTAAIPDNDPELATDNGDQVDCETDVESESDSATMPVPVVATEDGETTAIVAAEIDEIVTETPDTDSQTDNSAPQAVTPKQAIKDHPLTGTMLQLMDAGKPIVFGSVVLVFVAVLLATLVLAQGVKDIINSKSTHKANSSITPGDSSTPALPDMTPNVENDLSATTLPTPIINGDPNYEPNMDPLNVSAIGVSYPDGKTRRSDDAFSMIDSNPETAWKSISVRKSTFDNETGIVIRLKLDTPRLINAVIIDTPCTKGKIRVSYRDSDNSTIEHAMAEGSFDLREFVLKRPITTTDLELIITEMPKDEHQLNRAVINEINLR